MDEFEKIYNSIYADEDSQRSAISPEGVSVTATESVTPDNIHDSIADLGVTDDDYFAAYDNHERPAVSDSIYTSESFDDDILSDDVGDDISEVTKISNDNNPEEPGKGDKSSVDEDLDDIDLDEYEGSFTSKTFKDYLSARFAGIIIKLRGGVPPEATTATGEEDADELGAEIPLLDASKYYGSYVHSLKLRTRVAFVVLLILAYLSLGLPVTGRLNSAEIVSLMCMALQFNIILLSLDVFTNGVTNMFRGKFGADSLCVVSCIVTTVDAVMVYTGYTDAHVPLCLISSFSLFGVLLSSLLCSRGFRKALRVPAIGSTCFTVTGETGVTGREITLLKSKRKIDGFLRRMEEEPVDENIYRRVSIIIVIFALVLAAAITVITKNYYNALYIFSAVFTISVPFSALLCFSFPFFIGAYKLFPYGAAIAGWSGVTDLGHSKNLIITGRDLFPSNRIKIEGVRIFANYDSKKVIAYACAMIRESKCDLDVAFDSLGKENAIEDYRVDNFQCLSSGGLKGMIEGKYILCGNADFMKLMNIKVPSRLLDGTSVLLSIDGILYGIFDIKYKPDPKVRKALVSLMNSNRHAVFAVRDFNVTPEMIHDVFDIATDGYDFPAYIERFPLSEAKPAEDSKIAGVLCRGGLEPLIKLADTGRSLFVSSNTNVVISLISILVGAIMVSLVLILGSGITISGIFFYQLVSTIPIIVSSIVGSIK